MSRSLSQARELPKTLEEEIEETQRVFRRVCDQITGHELQIERLMVQQAGLFRRLHSLGITSETGALSVHRGRPDAYTVGERKAAILDVLRSRGTQTTAEIAKSVGMNPEATWKYLDRMVSRGEVTKVGRSQWTAA